MLKKFMVAFIVFSRHANRAEFGSLFVTNCKSENEALGFAYTEIRKMYDKKDYHNYEVIAKEITEEMWNE